MFLLDVPPQSHCYNLIICYGACPRSSTFFCSDSLNGAREQCLVHCRKLTAFVESGKREICFTLAVNLCRALDLHINEFMENLK